MFHFQMLSRNGLQKRRLLASSHVPFRQQQSVSHRKDFRQTPQSGISWLFLVLRSKKFVVVLLFNRGHTVCCRHVHAPFSLSRAWYAGRKIGKELIHGQIVPVENVTIHMFCFILQTWQKTLADNMALSTYFCRYVLDRLTVVKNNSVLR